MNTNDQQKKEIKGFICDGILNCMTYCTEMQHMEKKKIGIVNKKLAQMNFRFFFIRI